MSKVDDRVSTGIVGTDPERIVCARLEIACCQAVVVRTRRPTVRWIVSRLHLFLILLALAVPEFLSASQYSPLGMGRLLNYSTHVAVVRVPEREGEQEVPIEETLKGVFPQDFKVSLRVRAFPEEAKPVRFSVSYGKKNSPFFSMSGVEAGVVFDRLDPGNRTLVFLEDHPEHGLISFHSDCMQPISMKPRFLELIAMTQDPAPFASLERYAEDKDFIYLLGLDFWAFNLASPDLPHLGKARHFFRRELGLPEAFPWQRMRLLLVLTSDPGREPPLQLESMDASGPLSNALGKMENRQWPAFLGLENEPLFPGEFRVILDTQGPERVGNLKRQEAVNFLHAKLESGDIEVIRETYGALIRMMASETVPLAVANLSHPSVPHRTEAAKFLAAAKDPGSKEALCRAIDDLPDLAGRELGERATEEIAWTSALGKAIRALDDPSTVPTLKQAVLKGYGGSGMAWTLSRLGDESAFEILLSRADYCLAELVKRSNQAVEPWMKNQIAAASDPSVMAAQTQKWVAWWALHKSEFKIVR